ncbi:MAG: mandelate racemase/muconate lactonizing enzyme family protein [Bryobacteraceae bacterium]|nr:mandelate racemase/muconate lactonizing enzyme family protein [Bryobacteraceae bacterium]
MKIAGVEARAIRLPRDIAAATGTAGSPTVLAPGASDYRWSSVYPCLYSTNFETALVRVTTDKGVAGWGEAQAPLAPEVACTIVDRLLAPVLIGETIESPADIARLWDRMYSTMRVRGQTGGFMLDAISSIEIALWDIVGRAQGVSVAKLLSENPKTRVPAYLSGLVRGADPGLFDKVKVFYDTATPEEFFEYAPRHAAVDALWRLTPEQALDFGRELDRRGAMWFEAPLAPEDPLAHGELAAKLSTPVALGESYRTRYEMAPFYRANALRVFQPDLGRCGITEGRVMAERAVASGIKVAPHISIAFGPQIAAALHFAAATPECDLAEYNPSIVAIANRFLRSPIELDGTSYVVPDSPGLGIEIAQLP